MPASTGTGRALLRSHASRGRYGERVESERNEMIELHGDATLEGDYAWLRLDVREQRIERATGEGPGVATLRSELAGRTLLETASLRAEPLALEALHAALGDHVAAPLKGGRVAVAMSGGVDSAMALQAAIEGGFEPVGVTLRLWVDPSAPDTERACCSSTSVRAARALCHDHGVPHVTLDLREQFRSSVVDPFVAGYSAGLTPNPCVRCNGDFRFAQLDRFATRVGAERLATGHYARIVERDGQPLLARAHDESKDQSYMLASLTPASLNRLWFPLGGSLKRDNRMRAEALGLSAARAPESQEACFLGGADYRDFLERHGVGNKPGPIVDDKGHELGRHEGAWRYTPGQRKGLGLGGNRGPMFVVKTDASTGVVQVGSRGSLSCKHVRCDPGVLHTSDVRGEAKLRFRSPPVAARVHRRGTGFALELDEPVEAVAPGQLAALYVDDAVVGAGTIASATRD